MQFQVSMFSKTPAYEQIKIQIKEAVLTGRLVAGAQLPSIRLLAKDLGVGIITVKRAYDDLENENIILNMQGKGCFVKQIDKVKIKQIHINMLQERLVDIKEFVDSCGIEKDEVIRLIEETWRDKNA